MQKSKSIKIVPNLNFVRKFVRGLNGACHLLIFLVVFSSLWVLWEAAKLDNLEKTLFSIEWAQDSLLGGAVIFPKRTRPAPVVSRGIYLTAWTASIPRREELIELVKRTELNTMVIDVKDAAGKIFFDTQIPLADAIGSEEILLKNLEELLERLDKENIYTIARIVVFQDPILAQARPELALKNKNTGKLWLNYGGEAWVDPASPIVWKYNADIAKEAVRIGFDEVNFDYVRFPSDGQISLIEYPVWDGKTPKYEVMRNFFAYLHNELKNLPAYHSVDLFGLAVWDENYDLNVGQRLVDTLDYFDYICPMVYPSHYHNGFEGYANPAEFPYEVVYKTLMRANKQLQDARSKIQDDSQLTTYHFPLIRPWLQAFDIGAVYDAEMIKKEKQAVYDAGISSWLLWNPRNIYIEGALESN